MDSHSFLLILMRVGGDILRFSLRWSSFPPCTSGAVRIPSKPKGRICHIPFQPLLKQGSLFVRVWRSGITTAARHRQMKQSYVQCPWLRRPVGMETCTSRRPPCHSRLAVGRTSEFCPGVASAQQGTKQGKYCKMLSARLIRQTATVGYLGGH